MLTAFVKQDGKTIPTKFSFKIFSELASTLD